MADASQAAGTPSGLNGLQNRITEKYVAARVVWDKYGLSARVLALARCFICLFFFNQAYTGLEIWWYYRQPFPVLHAILLPASVIVMVDLHLQATTLFCGIMLVLALYDSGVIVVHQLAYFIQHGVLYINELMVKKMSMLGCVSLILVHRWKDATKRNSAVAGVLLSKVEETMSDKKSFAMLVGRLLISTLFLYVGWGEVKRQLETAWTDSEGHEHRKRANGDGHDNMWSKLSEFVLCIPFILGFKTKFFAQCLAFVLLAEAFVSWSWWTSTLNIGYQIHAREHFTVNVGTAGGLLLLCFIGAGKYTMDNFLKKND